ncbi:hypothetical protein COO60DRAFT_1534115, partial [Scenedesmus sp. NREL 46B-D3]
AGTTMHALAVSLCLLLQNLCLQKHHAVVLALAIIVHKWLSVGIYLRYSGLLPAVGASTAPCHVLLVCSVMLLHCLLLLFCPSSWRTAGTLAR